MAASKEIADLAPSKPSSGVLSLIPRPWVPYAELMRLHKPVGILNIYFPYLYGSLYAATRSEPPMPLSRLALANGLLFPIAFMLRSLGCAWNDLMDQDYDRQVARCRSRPLARGALSSLQGSVFCGVLAALWLAMLIPAGSQAAQYSLVAAGLATLYPFAKRVSNYAQVFLGVTLGWGTVVGCQVQGTGPFGGDASFACGLGALYLSYATWTVIHDTIYAFQDVRDDTAAGVKSTAVRFESSARPLLLGLSAVEVALHALTGYCMGAGWQYYAICCAGSAALLLRMIFSIDVTDPSQCWHWFRWGSLGIGCIIAAALVAEYSAGLAESQSLPGW